MQFTGNSNFSQFQIDESREAEGRDIRYAGNSTTVLLSVFESLEDFIPTNKQDVYVLSGLLFASKIMDDFVLIKI